MKAYHIDEGEIEIPEDWTDQSINILSSPGSAGTGFTITVARDNIPWGMDFTAYARRELDKLSENFNGFSENKSGTVTIDGKEAVLVDYTWTSPQGELHQLMAILPQSESRSLIITATMPGGFTESQISNARGILESFKARS